MTHEEKVHVANQAISALESVEAFSGGSIIEHSPEETDSVPFTINHEEHGQITLEVD